MRKIILILVAGAALFLFFVCGLFWNATRNSGPIKIAIAFSGFTNDATGSRLAAFKVSNLGGPGLFRWPMYNIEESGRPSPGSPRAFGRGDVIASGASTICLLPAPTNNAPWRVAFNFSVNDWRRKFAGFPPRIRGVVQPQSFSLPVTEGLSDWVGAVSLAPAPPASRDRLASVIVMRPSTLQRKTNSAAIAPSARKQ